MANLYFNEALSADVFEAGALVEVTGDEARHAVRVSRLRVGERILVGDGAGALGEGEVESIAKERFAVRLDHVERLAAASPQIVLAQALAKGDRDERAVEQATEFGVDAVLPWQAERSVSRWDGAGALEKAAKGVAKWQRIAKEASKQSLRARIPVVLDPGSLGSLCERAASAESEVLVLHPRGEATLSGWASMHATSVVNTGVREIVLVIGPEGGFSDGELDTLEAAGATVLVLGSTVLRTSSAGPAGIAVLNVALGRW